MEGGGGVAVQGRLKELTEDTEDNVSKDSMEGKTRPIRRSQAPSGGVYDLFVDEQKVTIFGELHIHRHLPESVAVQVRRHFGQKTLALIDRRHLELGDDVAGVFQLLAEALEHLKRRPLHVHADKVDDGDSKLAAQLVQPHRVYRDLLLDKFFAMGVVAALGKTGRGTNIPLLVAVAVGFDHGIKGQWPALPPRRLLDQRDIILAGQGFLAQVYGLGVAFHAINSGHAIEIADGHSVAGVATADLEGYLDPRLVHVAGEDGVDIGGGRQRRGGLSPAQEFLARPVQALPKPWSLASVLGVCFHLPSVALAGLFPSFVCLGGYHMVRAGNENEKSGCMTAAGMTGLCPAPPRGGSSPPQP